MKNLLMKLLKKQNENACLTLITNKRYKKCVELVKKPRPRNTLTYLFENVCSLRENRLNLRRNVTSLFGRQELYK